MKDIRIDRLIRSKRRTFSIEIEGDGSLVVRVPKRASMRTIEQIIDRRSRWIMKRQRLARERHAQARPKEYSNDEEFMYLGRHYRLRIGDDGGPALAFDNRNFVLSLEHIDDARGVFIDWYRDRVYGVISESAAHYSALSGIPFDRIRITSAMKRWGSCNARGNLCFSWRLAMAPPEVIDYVVVHELAHVEHRDHSPRFWNRIEGILPDFRHRRAWLRDNGHRLTL